MVAGLGGDRPLGGLLQQVGRVLMGVWVVALLLQVELLLGWVGFGNRAADYLSLCVISEVR